MDRGHQQLQLARFIEFLFYEGLASRPLSACCSLSDADMSEVNPVDTIREGMYKTLRSTMKDEDQ